MRTNSPLLILALASTLVACADKTPAPTTPRREAAAPARQDPVPRDVARPAPPPPEARRAPPPCVLQSPSKTYCLRVDQKRRPGCVGRGCRSPRLLQVFKASGELIFEQPSFRAGKPIHLTDRGVLVTDPRHAIVGPKALLLLLLEPGKTGLVHASDLLAPSRFLTNKPFRTERRGLELHVLLEGGTTVSFDLEALKVKAPDVHCQALAKGRVVVARSAFQALGTVDVGRGTCAKPTVEWSFQTAEAPIAVTRDGRRVITRNPGPFLALTSHVASVYQRKGKGGIALRQLGLRDLTKVTERLPPEQCQGGSCRALPSYDFALGGKLTLRFPWGVEKKIDLTSPALLRPRRLPFAVGPRRRPKTGPWTPFMGDAKAKATLVVYGNLQCPYTARLLLTLEDLLSVQKRGLKVVWLDFPLTFHKGALPAAIAARSVLAQKGPKAFFAFVAQVLANRRSITTENLATWARDVGAKPELVRADLAAEKGKADILASRDQGQKLGVRGTPTLFLNGAKAGHANGFWAIRSQLAPILGRALRKVR